MLKTQENVEKSAKAHEDLAQDAEAMSEELRPCPFCGGKAVYRGTGQVYVRCLACGARSRGTVERYRSNLAALWNMRTEDRRHDKD